MGGAGTSLPHPELAAVVEEARPLVYDDPPDPAWDLPDHVRSGSALIALGKRLVVVQDDIHALALVGLEPWSVGPLLLPPGPGGSRRFDDFRGNKALKLDLEAGFILEGAGPPFLLALGSGSTPRREVAARVDLRGDSVGPARLIPLPGLYANLREITAFSGSELNLEGAFQVGGRVGLVNRGNGAAAGGQAPTDAVGWLALEPFMRYLDAPESEPPPPLLDVVSWDLGQVEGVRLTFTDALPLPTGKSLLYLAAAEDSPDAVQDGPVLGGAVGVLGTDGGRWARIRNMDGSWSRAKVEGLAPDPFRPGRILAVTDPDGAWEPAELLRIRLDGPWGLESLAPPG